MEAIPTDPRTLDRSEAGPIHHYHVVFWRQPAAPEGRPQETMLWAAHEHEVIEVTDVHEVIAWADNEARARKAAYTIYAVIEIFVPRNEVLGEAVTEFDRREIAVWLGGWLPTRLESNFGRLLPPGAQPVWGTAEDVYTSKQD